MGACEGVCRGSKSDAKGAVSNTLQNNQKANNQNYVFPNGDYYIGPVINNVPNGKGQRFTKNGALRYEGDFVNGYAHGKGKLIWDDGGYYIGDWVNNKRDGKGQMFYKNGKIKYDGDFVNDKYEGKGKYIFENGEYYIGEWYNGQRHGKGAMYLSNGYLKYEGNFVNDTFKGENDKQNPDYINNSSILFQSQDNNGNNNSGPIYIDGDYIYGNINPPSKQG